MTISSIFIETFLCQLPTPQTFHCAVPGWWNSFAFFYVLGGKKLCSSPVSHVGWKRLPNVNVLAYRDKVKALTSLAIDNDLCKTEDGTHSSIHKQNCCTMFCFYTPVTCWGLLSSSSTAFGVPFRGPQQSMLCLLMMHIFSYYSHLS